MFTIIGSGFGVYGYLPALIEEADNSLILPVIMREQILQRNELAVYLPRIQWVESQKDALSKSDGVVIAVPPKEQVNIVDEVLCFPNICKLILEKPLAADPLSAAELVSRILKTDKQLRAGYTLSFTSWWAKILWPAKKFGATYVSVKWTFMAYHFSHNINNWKRKHSEGGGVLRFYGIHLVALLGEVGYTEVSYSKFAGKVYNEPDYWEAIFIGNNLPDCYVHVNSRCQQSEFQILAFNDSEQSEVFHDVDPFYSEGGNGIQDRRVSALRRLIVSFKRDNAYYIKHIKHTNTLWNQLESVTVWLSNNRFHSNLIDNLE